MDAAILLVRVSLSALFVVAAVGKVRDPAGSRESVRKFGIPTAAAPFVAASLIAAEFIAAAALAWDRTARWGAALAALLLLSFTVVIAWNLAHGRRLACRCFGQAHEAPANAQLMVRDVLLTAGALLVVGWPGDSALALKTAQQANAAAALLLAGQGWLMMGMLRQQGRLLSRIDHLERVSPTGATHNGRHQHPLPMPVAPFVAWSAPGFTLPDTAGHVTSLDELRQPGLPVVLLFTDSACQACRALDPDLTRWRKDSSGAFTLAILGSGSLAELAASVNGAGPVLVLRR